MGFPKGSSVASSPDDPSTGFNHDGCDIPPQTVARPPRLSSYEAGWEYVSNFRALPFVE